MDKLWIINSALMKTGLPLAASLDDCDWNANYIYDNCTEQVLRSFAWGFAQKFASLPRESSEPQFAYKYYYRVPDDCLRLIDVHCQQSLRSPKARFSQQGKLIATNVSPCYLRYVARQLNPEDWPPDFADAVACLIATQIAALSAEKAGLVPHLLQYYQLALTQAQLSDARENTERVPLDSSIYAARGDFAGNISSMNEGRS